MTEVTVEKAAAGADSSEEEGQIVDDEDDTGALPHPSPKNDK
jgi:hypothetical protein